MPRKPIEERFMNLVDVTDACWLWKGSKNWGGYGQFSFTGGKRVMAHRFSWEHFNNQIPENLLVLHKCDVRNCVNPDHLFLGTQKDNMQDMLRKNRQSNGDKKGEKNPRAKLTKSDVMQIRKTYIPKDKNNNQRALSERYGVSTSQICKIISGEKWGPNKKSTLL